VKGKGNSKIYKAQVVQILDDGNQVCVKWIEDGNKSNLMTKQIKGVVEYNRNNPRRNPLLVRQMNKRL